MNTSYINLAPIIGLLGLSLSLVACSSPQPDEAMPQVSETESTNENQFMGNSPTTGGSNAMPTTDMNSNQTSVSILLPERSLLFGQPIDEIPAPVAQPGDEVLSWSYEIVDEQLSNVFYEPPLTHKFTWERFSSLIPYEYRESLDSFTFVVDLNQSTICSNGDAAIFSEGFGRTEPGGETTSMVVCEALAASYSRENLSSPVVPDLRTNSYIWIHETGHIIEASFTADLITPNGEFYDTGLSGAEFPVGIHTPKSSPVGDYYRQFWDNEIRDAHISLGNRNDIASALYAQFPDSFVTVYAATDFAEDYAESFSQFVLAAEQPLVDGSMATDKVRWFWSWPELVLMRDDVRSRL